MFCSLLHVIPCNSFVGNGILWHAVVNQINQLAHLHNDDIKQDHPFISSNYPVKFCFSTNKCEGTGSLIKANRAIHIERYNE
jgi:hypothetical protein